MSNVLSSEDSSVGVLFVGPREVVPSPFLRGACHYS
jgi:hypothetical protein